MRRRSASHGALLPIGHVERAAAIAAANTRAKTVKLVLK